MSRGEAGQASGQLRGVASVQLLQGELRPTGQSEREVRAEDVARRGLAPPCGQRAQVLRTWEGENNINCYVVAII